MKNIIKNSSSFINGEWVQSQGHLSICNPANLQEHIHDIHLATGYDTNSALLAAQEAFDVWGKTRIEKRILLLEKFISNNP